ncbi:DUF4157 domain-containing protein [Streptomyces sp. NPDC096176]|uniref:eCIS core domain-containing protein n=1 Tax=Streptomyces sp. NPDC096176 TaxID=3366079 RepID=UPI00381B7B43
MAQALAGRLSPHTALSLQRAAGNAVVTRIVAMERERNRPDGAEEHEHPVQRSAVHDVLRSHGQPLDSSLRTEMEARFGGADFGGVRVHSDSVAQRSAAEIGARAYTSGNHIVTGKGGTDEHTLVHELTHVVQQRSGPVAGTDNGQGLSLSHPSDRFEHEAEANAARIVAGAEPLPLQRMSAGSTAGGDVAVQRYVEMQPGDASYPSKHRRASVVSNKSADSDDHFFPSQHEVGDSYFADAANRTPNIRFNSAVPLRFSDSYDLAIEIGPGESKVFFATENHINAANKALAGRVRLHKGTRYLQVQGERGALKLYQVKPVVETKTQGWKGKVGMTTKATGLSILTPQRCNEMAEFVTGKKGISSEGIGAWESFLARVLDLVDGTEDTHLKGIKEAFQKGVNGDKDAYLAYSQNMSRRFQDLKAADSPELDQALRQLGLNEFLPPPAPGSALVTVGYGDADQESARDRAGTFEYHFGAAIAASGNDYITMENYARRDAEVGNSTASSGDPLFFFKMYGTVSGAGETWHEAQVATSGFIGAILSINLVG